MGLLNHFPEVLVHGEGDGLAGGNTHDTGGDALVEGVESLLPKFTESVTIWISFTSPLSPSLSTFTHKSRDD